ncbi:SCO3242 family prenyltransferase [Streptomyces anulatus]|uniref:SCO3242 family prenyltransferase n=1 Tax=Streptomyces anulatus TaxID=1892 RepID=UPI0004C7339A|nr:UbiA family prenyltransferase [Streptomyces anulatus]
MRRRPALPAALVAALPLLPAGRGDGFALGGPTAVTQDSLSGAGGTAPAPDRPGPPPAGRNGERGADDAGPGRPAAGSERDSDRAAPRERLRAWAELLRVSALFSVPGDALAGAAAVGRRPGRGTALAMGASLCLYEAGMALNDWADRDEDAVDRPHRPIPSGRVSPAAALGAAGVLTAAGLALAARAGRPALTVATGLAATVWAYDLHLKHTKAGPAAMAAARSLDLLLGATATAAATGVRAAGRSRSHDHVAGASAAATATAVPTPGALTASLPALPAALVLGAHTYGVTAVSRHEAQGGSTGTPLAVLATTTALAAAVLGVPPGQAPDRSGATTAQGGAGPRDANRTGWADAGTGATPRPGALLGRGLPGWATDPTRLLLITLTGACLRTAGPPLLHAALNPSPQLTQRAVGGGIRAMIPLQAALAARAGAPVTGLAVMGLVPLARSLARKVSLT